MSVFPVEGVRYWWDGAQNAFVAPGRPLLPVTPPVVTGGRDSLVLGSYVPDDTTTGVLPGTTLTPRTSGQPVGGQTYENIDWQMQVVPPTGTQTITMRNCKFSGAANGPPGTTGTEGLIKLHNDAHCPMVFIDCTMRPQFLTNRWTAFHGHTYQAIRCDVSYTVDLFSVFNTHNSGAINVDILQCYGHDLAWFNNTIDPSGPGDGSHNDCVQWQGGIGGSIRGNNLQGFNAPGMPNIYYGNTTQSNSVFMIKPDVALITGLVIEDNYLAGGQICTLNVAHDTSDGRTLSATTQVARIWRNKFVRDSSRSAIEVLSPTGPVVPSIDWGTGTSNANVFSDNGAPVTISPGGSS